MEQRWHSVVIENDEGDDVFLKAAPLLLEALRIIESAKTLTAAVQLSHRTNELFSGFETDDNTSRIRFSSSSFGKICRSIEKLRAKQKIMYPVLDVILSAFVHVQHCDSAFSTSPTTETGLKVAGINSDSKEHSFSVLPPEKDNMTENPGECARFPLDPRGYALPNEMRSHRGLRPTRRTHEPLIVCHKNGLIYPQQMFLDRDLFEHPTLDYTNFRECFGRLSDIAADPKLFTACEPRLRILKSRYALYSAYNGSREDQCDSVMGGGSVMRAPKSDIRRLETCISARSLLKFIESICRSDPNYVVIHSASDNNSISTDGDEGSSNNEPQKRTSLNTKRSEEPPKSEERGLTCSKKSCVNESDAEMGNWEARNRVAEGEITVRDLVMRFCGVEGKRGDEFPLNHGRPAVDVMSGDATRALTPEGLFLTPQYARAINGSWPDLHHTPIGEKKIPSEAQYVYENLRNFLSINNENKGDLFAKFVVPALSRILHTPGSEFDAIELEVTVNGSERGELDRIADWCVRSGILEENRICFSIHVTQGAFATPTEDSPHQDEESAPWWWVMCQEHLSKTDRNDLSGKAETFQDVLQNIFEPIWEALLDPESYPSRVRFLQRLTSFSISLGHASAVLQELPVVSTPSQYPLRSSDAAPSNAFVAFHIQRNVQLLNCFTCAHEYFYRTRDSNETSTHGASKRKKGGVMESSKKHGNHYTDQGTAGSPGDFHFWNDTRERYDSEFTYSHHLPFHTLYHHHAPIIPGPLRLRLHSNGSNNSRTMFTESILGLLIADEIVNPTQAFEWGPLTYLYYLTQRHLVLTPSSNHHSNSTIKNTLTDNAILLAIRVGLHVSISTLNPLFFYHTDEALNEELLNIGKHLGLATTDLTEMCLRSMESRMPHFRGNCHVVDGDGVNKGNRDHFQCFREAFWGEAWPRVEARYNNFPLTQVSSLRLNFRDAALCHEMDLLCRKALPQAHTDPSFEVSSMSFSSPALATARIGRASFLDDISLCMHESQVVTRWNRLYTFFNIPSSCLSSATEEEWDGNRKDSTARKHRRHQSHHEHLEAALRFPRIKIIGPKNESPSDIAKMVVHCMALRQNYQQYDVRPSLSFYRQEAEKSVDKRGAGSSVSCGKSDSSGKMGANPAAPPQPTSYAIRDGVIDVLLDKSSSRSCNEKRGRQKNTAVTSYNTHPFVPLPTWATFQQHVLQLRALSSNHSVQEFCSKRLGMLECKYNLHIALTKDDEEAYFVEIPSGEYEDANLTTECLSSNPKSSEGEKMSNTALDGAVTRHATHSNSASNSLLVRRDSKADVFNIVKVDVHCHMAGGFTAKSLLSFLKHKVQFNGDDVIGVDAKTGLAITLGEMYRKVVEKRLDLLSRANNRVRGASPHRPHLMRANEVNPAESLQNRIQGLTIAALDVQAGKATFNRFDEFNSRYSPMRVSELRSLLLKTDNFMGGRYFAELIRSEVFDKNEREGNIFTENRLSIYGRDHGEWMRLAKWAFIHGMAHHTNRWMIQIPRLFNLYRLSGVLRNFEEMLWNIFNPLWEASLHPEKHPLLHYFLQHVSGFDSVDDESSLESGEMVFLPPAQWTRAENPPFAYYMYYMWANITTLNRFRASKGLCTFDFRPHAGESGDPDHMADVFFLANGIGHGINLMKRPVLRYLYYLTQIPLAIVPLSNNALFCKYSDNPFPTFFRQGLNVSLGTDGALMFHNTEQPLLEEYTTAQNVWSLSAADVCEIAKRSVLMSGFSPRMKAQWLGDRFFLHSVVGNDVEKSHLPMTRCALRYDVYMDEISYLEARAAMDVVNRAMFTPAEEDLILMDTMGCSRVEALSQCLLGCPTSIDCQSCERNTKHEKSSAHSQGNVPEIVSSRRSSHISQCASGSSILAQSQL
ncbi:unnamed protein product [Phytomonas sp. EM1]|nr:unnamed protein product [Phytomonas sp. EM1]|eukprot:CCW61849.1 unnamed protein product [Phytomonas sp. isolate EM1]